MGNLELKIHAPSTYVALAQWTGISQSTINAALDGDLGAANSILEFAESAKARSANAETILSNLSEGVEALGEIISLESKFLATASNTFTKTSKEVNGAFQGDERLFHTTVENQLQHRLTVDNERKRHNRQMNLLPIKYKTDDEVGEINHGTARYQLGLRLNEAKENQRKVFQQLSPRQQHLNNLQKVGGSAVSLGSGVSSFASKVFRFLFG
jgi:hypothetical protein